MTIDHGGDSVSDEQKMVRLREWSKTLADIDIRMFLEDGVPPNLLVGGVLDIDGLVALGWSVLNGISAPSSLCDETGNP